MIKVHIFEPRQIGSDVLSSECLTPNHLIVHLSIEFLPASSGLFPVGGLGGQGGGVMGILFFENL